MVGIRREDKNEWERRAPLTPDHVAELTQAHGIDIRVQPSPSRAFPDQDYRSAGAQLANDLSACSVILGIKEIPAEALLAGATYVVFSHTSKAQPHNMPMLRRMLELGCTLVDYEQIFDARGRRLVFFGRHAGYAGMIDALWALGQRLAAEGHATPFRELRLAHEYASLDEATLHIARAGEQLRHDGLPLALRPLVFGFTGSGNVTLGAQEILDRLPVVALDVGELARAGQDSTLPQNVVFKVVFEREQRFARRDGGAVDRTELSLHPERYASGIERWLPFLTVLVHGAFWAPPQPRLVTRTGLRELWAGPTAPRLRLLADIACDIGGGIEATLHATTPGDPVYLYDVEAGCARATVSGRGPLVLAIDNLPCQLPRESSEHFGDTLMRFVPVLARCAWQLPLDALGLPPEIRRAVIVHRGSLTPEFGHLERHVR